MAVTVEGNSFNSTRVSGTVRCRGPRPFCADIAVRGSGVVGRKIQEINILWNTN